MIEAKPENLIGDGAYDSSPLDEALHHDGIEMIAPQRSTQNVLGFLQLACLIALFRR